MNGGVLRKESGMALLITIVVVALLVVLILQFGRNMRQEGMAAANLRDEEILETMTASGVNIAMEVLVRDGRANPCDSFHDAWGRLSGRDLSPLFEQGALRLDVSDLAGRLQVNSLVSARKGEQGADAATAAKMREILGRLLLSGKFGALDEQQAREIVDSLVDWIDADDLPSPFGAEESYYRSLEHPYGCKNRPVEFIEELLLVKGMRRDILFGSQEHQGLAPYLTVHGNDGRININTAAPVLLQAMERWMTPEAAQEMVDFRDDEKNVGKLSAVTWYKEIPGWSAGRSFEEKIVTTRSNVFEIVAAGELHAMKQTVRVAVRREPDNSITVLSRKVE